jgi:hypothetical protein
LQQWQSDYSPFGAGQTEPLSSIENYDKKRDCRLTNSKEIYTQLTFSRPPRDVTSMKRRYRSSGFPPIVGTLHKQKGKSKIKFCSKSVFGLAMKKKNRLSKT